MKKSLFAFLFCAAFASAQPTPPSTGALTVNMTTGNITAPAAVTPAVFASANSLATLSGSEILTNKTISGAANTITNIPGSALNTSSVPNSALANASVTISGYSLALGGALALAQADIGGLHTTDAVTFASLTTTGNVSIGGATTIPGITTVFAGDSLTAWDGNGGIGASKMWPSRYLGMYDPLGITFEHNSAVSGQTAATILANYSAQIGVYKPANGQVGTLALWAGTNDIGGGASGATVFSTLGSIWGLAHSDNYKVLAFTITPSTGWDSSKETQRLALNTSVRASTVPDWIYDVGGILTDPSNTINFLDGLHFTATAEQGIAWGVLNTVHNVPYPRYDFLTDINTSLNGAVTNQDSIVTAIGRLQGDKFSKSGGTITGTTVFSGTASTLAQAYTLSTLSGSGSYYGFKDAAGTPHHWWIGLGKDAGNDGVFTFYDFANSAQRAWIDANGITSAQAVTANNPGQGFYFGSSARVLWNAANSTVDAVNAAASAFVGFRADSFFAAGTGPSSFTGNILAGSATNAFIGSGYNLLAVGSGSAGAMLQLQGAGNSDRGMLRYDISGDALTLEARQSTTVINLAIAGSNKLTIATTGAASFASTVQTALGVTYDFGAASATTITSADHSLHLKVGGTDYYVPAKLTNN